MTYAPHGSATPPGWYPDPAFPQQLRWWDGVQWTPHLAPFAGQFTGQPLQIQRVRISDQAPVYNPFIWAVTLLPLVPLLLLLTWQPDFRLITTRQGATTLDPLSIYSGGYIALQLSGFLVWAVGILCAYLDHQRLTRSGVIRPFHWAWCFLSPMVYIIGRTVIVRKVAPDRGLAPIWAMIAVVVVSFIVTGVWMTNFMSQIYSQIGYSVSA